MDDKKHILTLNNISKFVLLFVILLIFILLTYFIFSLQEISLINMLSIFFILFIIKFILGLITYKVTIDTKSERVFLRRSVGSFEINTKNLTSWGIRTIQVSGAGTIPEKFLEFHYKNNKIIIYPARVFRKQFVDQNISSILSKIFEQKPKKYETLSPSTLKSLKYEFFYIWV
jgi:hypothetical protein